MIPSSIRFTSTTLSLCTLLAVSADSLRDSPATGSTVLKVTTVKFEPYTMLREDIGRRNVSGKERYHGCIPDLLHQLSVMLGFDYDIYEVDGFGHRLSDGTWDGMIGELVSKKADIAASAMYVNEYRDKVVDFSTPFMDVGATLLLRKPPAGHTLHIKSVRDLINQSEIKYGMLKKGLINRDFRTGNSTIFSKMWRNMQSFKPSVFTESNEDGIARVRSEKYAYILPSTIGDYVTMRPPCDLVTVDKFMERGYALASTKGSPWLKKLNTGIRALRKSGFLDKLYRKWWLERNECSGVRTSRMYRATAAVTVPNTLSAPSLYVCLFAAQLLHAPFLQ